MKQLRSYQKTALERFGDAFFFCLNFACGLGKTLTAALIAQHKGLPTMVIAPNSLCEQWRDELIELGVDPQDIFIANAPEEHKDPEGYAKKFDAWLARR
jgi:superfamily II DNA or RNA helicase